MAKYQTGQNIISRGTRVLPWGGAKQGYKPRNQGPKTVDFSLPVSNPFGPLAQLDQTPMRPNYGNLNGTSNSKKHLASSPLDDENGTKRQRDDLVIHASDVDSESDDSDMHSQNWSIDLPGYRIGIPIGIALKIK